MIRRQLELPLDAIAEICTRYGVLELAVFGSALRSDFGPESDVDFLVTFEGDDSGPWMQKLPQLEEQLAALLNRQVDVVSRRGIEQSANWVRRNEILDSAVVVYER